MTQPIPLIIDTDMASDDWMAILYLLMSPLVDIEAITVVATGEAMGRPGARNALRLLRLVEKSGIPVAYGRPKPLGSDNKWPLIVRFAMNTMLFLRLPRPQDVSLGQTAVDVLIDILERAEEPQTVFAIGPLTNIAEALQAAPHIKAKIGKLMIMGGAVNVHGNITPDGFSMIDNHTAEWNIYCDPHAANIVFQSGLPITLVPLDVTNTVPLTPEFYAKAAAYCDTPAAYFVYRTLTRLKRMIMDHKYYFWDPLAAVLITHPELGDYQEMRVKVIEEAGPDSGNTIEAADGGIMQVCVSVDQARFEDIFLNTLNGEEL